MINAMAIQSICPKTKCHRALLSAEGAAFLNVCRRGHGCVWTSIDAIGSNVELGGAAGVLDVISGRSWSASDNLDENMGVNRCAIRPQTFKPIQFLIHGEGRGSQRTTCDRYSLKIK